MRTGSNACFFINGKLIDRVKMAMEKTVLSQGLNGDRAANPAQSKPSVFGNLEFGKVPPWPELGFDPANYRRGGLVSAVTRRLGQATPEAGLHIDQLLLSPLRRRRLELRRYASSIGREPGRHRLYQPSLHQAREGRGACGARNQVSAQAGSGRVQQLRQADDRPIREFDATRVAAERYPGRVAPATHELFRLA